MEKSGLWGHMKLYQVDSFTSVAFRGNPAGVWIGETFPADSMMQSLAAEVNASETAFVACGGGRFQIRYFTPTREVPLCGHATLASAHILRELGKVEDGVAFMLHAAETELPVRVTDGWVHMAFPVYPLTRIEIPGYLEPLIGSPVTEAFKSDNNWIVARLPDERCLLAARPDFPAIQAGDAAVLIAATTESADADYDFSVRVFCNPAYGIEEDPVTGAAQCILAPYWHGEVKKELFVSRQLSRRGGEMKAKILGEAVEIMGQAVTVFVADVRYGPYCR